MTEKQKDIVTITAIIVVAGVLMSHDGSGNTMCDDNAHTLQPPCAP